MIVFYPYLVMIRFTIFWLRLHVDTRLTYSEERAGSERVWRRACSPELIARLGRARAGTASLVLRGLRGLRGEELEPPGGLHVEGRHD